MATPINRGSGTVGGASANDPVYIVGNVGFVRGTGGANDDGVFTGTTRADALAAANTFFNDHAETLEQYQANPAWVRELRFTDPNATSEYQRRAANATWQTITGIIEGATGGQGVQAPYQILVYQNSATEPAIPTTGTYDPVTKAWTTLPTDWTATASTPSGDEFTWAASAMVDPESNTSAFTPTFNFVYRFASGHLTSDDLIEIVSTRVVTSGTGDPDDANAVTGANQVYFKHDALEITDIALSNENQNVWHQYAIVGATITGGSVSGTTLTLDRSRGTDITIPGLPSGGGGGGSDDGVVTGGSVSGTTLTLERSVGADVDIPGLPSGTGVDFDFQTTMTPPDNSDADVGQNELYFLIDSDGNLTEIGYSSELSGTWNRLPIDVTSLAGVPGLGTPFVTKTLISSPNPGADELFFDENVQPDVHRVTFRNTGGQYPPDFLDSDLIDGYFYMKASPSGAIRTGPIDSVSESSSNLYEIEFVNIVVSGSETDFPDSGSVNIGFQQASNLESIQASSGSGAPDDDDAVAGIDQLYLDITGSIYYSLGTVDTWMELPITGSGASIVRDYSSRDFAINELAVYIGTMFRATADITSASVIPPEDNSNFEGLFSVGMSDEEQRHVTDQFLRFYFSSTESATTSQIDIEDDDLLLDNADGTVTNVSGHDIDVTIPAASPATGLTLGLRDSGPNTSFDSVEAELYYQIDSETPVLISSHSITNTAEIGHNSNRAGYRFAAHGELTLTLSDGESLRAYMAISSQDPTTPVLSIFGNAGNGPLLNMTYDGVGGVSHLILRAGHITARSADGTFENLLSLSGVPQGPFEAHLGSRTFRTALIYRTFPTFADIVSPDGGIYVAADEDFTLPTDWSAQQEVTPDGVQVVSVVELYHNNTIRYLDPIALPTGEGIDDATLALEQRKAIPISPIEIPALDSIIRYSSWEALDGDVDTELFRVRYQESNQTELMITGVTDGNIVVTNRHGVIDEYDWAQKIRALRIARSHTDDIYIYINQFTPQTRGYDSTEPQPILPHENGSRALFAIVPAGSNFPNYVTLSPAGLPAFKFGSDVGSYDRSDFDMERESWSMLIYGRATADNGMIVAGDTNTFPAVRFEGDGLATHTNQDPSNNSIDVDIRQWATFGIASLPTAQAWEIYHDNQSLLVPVGEQLHAWGGLELNVRDAEFTDLIIAFPNTEPTSAFEAMVGGREDDLLAGQLLRRPEIDYNHDSGAQQWQEAAGQGLEANDYVTRAGLALRANAPTTAPDSTDNFEETNELEKVYAHGAKSLPESLVDSSGEFRFGVRLADPITFSSDFHQVFEATDNHGEFRAKIDAQFTMDAVSHEFGVVRGQAGGNNLRITDVQFAVILNGSRQIIAQNTDSVNTDRYRTYRRNLVGGIFTLNVVVGDLIRFNFRVLPTSAQQYVSFETFDFRWTGSVNATVGHEVIAENSPQEQWGFTRDGEFYPVLSSTGEILADSQTYRQLESLLFSQRGLLDVHREDATTPQGVMQLFLKHLIWAEQEDDGSSLPTDDTNENFIFPVVQRVEGFGHESPSTIDLRLNPHRWNDDTNNVQSLIVGPGFTADVANLSITVSASRAEITLPTIDSNYAPGRGLRIHNDNAEELTLTVYFRYRIDSGNEIAYGQVTGVVVPANGNTVVEMEAMTISIELEQGETLHFFPELSVPETDELYIEGENFNLVIGEDDILVEFADGAAVDAAKDGDIGIYNPLTDSIVDVFDRDGNLLGPSAQDFARGIPKWMLGIGTTQGQFIEFARQFWEVLQTNPGITIPSRAPDTYAGIGARFIGRPRHDVAGARVDVDFRQLHWTRSGHSIISYADPTAGAYLTYDSATQTLTCEGEAAQISIVPIVASDSRNRFRLVSFGSHVTGIEYMRFTTSLNGATPVTRQEHLFDPPFTVLGAQSAWFDLLGPDVVQVFQMTRGDTLRLAFELNHAQSDTGLVVSPDFRFRFDITAYSDDGYRLEVADGNKLVSIDEQQEVQTEEVIWRPHVSVDIPTKVDNERHSVVLPDDYTEFDKLFIQFTGQEPVNNNQETFHTILIQHQITNSFTNLYTAVILDDSNRPHVLRLNWDPLDRSLTFGQNEAGNFDTISQFTSIILDG